MEDNATFDSWNEGAVDALRNKPRKANGDADYIAGYSYGLEERQIRAAIYPRPN